MAPNNSVWEEHALSTKIAQRFCPPRILLKEQEHCNSLAVHLSYQTWSANSTRCFVCHITTAFYICTFAHQGFVVMIQESRTKTVCVLVQSSSPPSSPSWPVCVLRRCKSVSKAKGRWPTGLASPSEPTSSLPLLFTIATVYTLLMFKRLLYLHLRENHLFNKIEHRNTSNNFCIFLGRGRSHQGSLLKTISAVVPVICRAPFTS